MLAPVFATLVVTMSSSLLSAKTLRHSDAFFHQSSGKNTLKITSFNAHNLYDHTHDRGYFDYTFLPLSHRRKKSQCKTLSSPYYKDLCLQLDWTSKKVNQKIGQLIRALKSAGSLPDLLGMQEIENDNILKKFAKKAGYRQYLVTNQKSKRGIDVGLLWNDKKLDYVDHVEIEAPLRDPLRVEFQIRKNGETLFVYINHWAAQSAPTSWRADAAQALREDMEQVQAEMPEANIVVLGDFNVTSGEEDDVFDRLTKRSSPSRLYDAHTLSRKRFPSYSKRFPDGTYFSRFHQHWSRFDRIFVNKNLLNGGTQADIKSYRIVFTKFLVQSEKIENSQTGRFEKVQFPKAYNFLEADIRKLGVSDHLPVSLSLRLR